MNSNSREKDPTPMVKQEGTTRSRWSMTHKNPRIVRVSRAFGGKDRHSKVCTVRGLRDRRIRLSVPTAVQLYELQDKLGLSQPSKVVDWLIDATKSDIDKLPPLPTIPGIFPNPNQEFPPQASSLSQFLASKQGMIKFDDEREKEKEKEKWIEQENRSQNEGFGGFVAQNLFPLGQVNQNPQSQFFQNNPYFQWDQISQFGPNYINPLPNQEDHQSSSHHNMIINNPSNTHLYFNIPPFPSYLPPSMEPNPGFSTALHLTRPFAFKPAAQPHHGEAERSETKED